LRKKRRPKEEIAPVGEDHTSTDLQQPTEEHEAAPSPIGYVLPLAACVLVGPAVLATQFPFGHWIALILAITGSGLAGMSFLIEDRFKLAAIGGIIVNPLLALCLLIFPGMLGLQPILQQPEPTNENEVRSQRFDTMEYILNTDVIDGTNAAWIKNDVKLSIHGVFVGAVEMENVKGDTTRSKEPMLQMKVTIANVGFSGPLDLKDWATESNQDGITLIGNSGKTIKSKTLPSGWKPAKDKKTAGGAVMPGGHTDILLLFERPTLRGDDTVILTLPGKAVGVEDTIRFEFPASFLGARP
jgi:hypothetical protein